MGGDGLAQVSWAKSEGDSDGLFDQEEEPVSAKNNRRRPERVLPNFPLGEALHIFR